MGQVSPRAMLEKAEQLELDKLKPTRIKSLNTSPVKVPAENLSSRWDMLTPAYQKVHSESVLEEQMDAVETFDKNLIKVNQKKSKLKHVKRKKKVQKRKRAEITTEELLARKDRTSKIDALIRRYRVSDSETFKIMQSVIMRTDKTEKELAQIKRWMLRICPFLEKLDADLVLQLANLLSYSSYKYGEEVCNINMCGIIVEGKVSARTRTQDEVFQDMMRESQVAYDDIEESLKHGEPLLNVLTANNTEAHHSVIESFYRDVPSISGSLFHLISHLQDRPISVESDFLYTLRRYNVQLKRSDIETIFAKVHVNYLDEDEKQNILAEKEAMKTRQIQVEKDKAKAKKETSNINLFGNIDVKTAQVSKGSDTEDDYADDDFEDDYADDDFENDDFEEEQDKCTARESNVDLCVISEPNFKKWFAAHSAESRVLMHALLDELSEIYHNFLKPKVYADRNEYSKVAARKTNIQSIDQLEMAREGFFFLCGEHKSEKLNETWEHFIHSSNGDICQNEFIMWCLKFPEKARLLLDGKRRCKMDSEVNELYDLIKSKGLTMSNNNPENSNCQFRLYLDNIIIDEFGETPTFDEFKAWYFSESIEAVGLGYEFINLKRIWLGQKIFTFCDVSSCGYITETSFQKALKRLNIRVPPKRLESILSQFSDKERGKKYIKEANELQSTHLDISSFCTWFCNYTLFSNILMTRALSLLNTSSRNNTQGEKKYYCSQQGIAASDARTKAIASSIFNGIDAPLKGYISLQEVVYLFKKFDYPGDVQNLYKALSKIDKQGRGIIDKESFAEWFVIGNELTSFLNIRYLINKIDNERNPEIFLNTGSLVGNRWLSDIGGPNYATYKAASDNTGVILIPRSAYDNRVMEQEQRELRKIAKKLQSTFPLIFQKWSKNRLERFCQHGKAQTIQNGGTIIYQEGDPNTSIYFILDGAVSLYTTIVLRSTTVIPTVDKHKTLKNVQDNVKRVTLRKLRSGHFFGENGVLAFEKSARRKADYEEYHTHNASTTMDDTTLFRVQGEEAMSLLHSSGAARLLLKEALVFDRNKVAADFALKRKQKRFLKSSLLMEAPKYAKRRMDAKRKLDKSLAEARKLKKKQKKLGGQQRLKAQRMTISKSMPALSSIPHLPVVSPIVDYNTLKIKQNKNIRHAVLLSDNMPFQNAYQQINIRRAKRWFQGEIPRTRFNPKLTWNEDGTLEVSDNYDRAPRKPFPKLIQFEDSTI